jgi:hypothetical protein
MTAPQRVDYYTVRWRGPDTFEEGHRFYKETEKYGHRKYHEKDFHPLKLKAATALAKKMAKTPGVTDVRLNPIEIVGKDIGFPMAFVGKELSY